MTEWLYCPECKKTLVEKPDVSSEIHLSCPEGHFVHYQNSVPSATAFLENDGEFLILKRATPPQKGAWHLPAGFLNFTEVPREAILREIFEETGIRSKILSLIGIYNSAYGDTGKRSLVTSFHCQSPTKEVTLSSESSECQWLPLDQIPKLAFSDDNEALADLRKQLN